LFFVYFLVQANIICPLYRKGTRAADVEKYIIYNVSREEFENCQGPIL
jgi:ephrin-B